jgi:hypothetical protein
MKKLLMIVGMMLAAASAPVWAADEAQQLEAGKHPPATIAWGEAVNGVQAGLVPLGGVKGDGWGEGRDLFFCPKCANRPRKACMDPDSACAGRICAVCQAPKPWNATFIEGEPMGMELHFRNLAKEVRSLYDAGYGQHWRFTFAPRPAGPAPVFKTVWTPRKDARELATIELRGIGQMALELEPGEDGWGFHDPHSKQPEFRSLPAGKYTVTATYAHPEHEQAKPCPYWHGTVTTGPVEIEIKADDAAARFLDAAKYAGFAAVAEVKALPQAGEAEKPAQLGIEWQNLLYAPDAVRQAMAKVTALALPYLKPGVADTRATAELKVGDRILVVADEQARVILPDGSSINFADGKGAVNLPENGGARLNGAQWLPWTQSRQDALQAALAPGWREGACPWCRRHEELFEGVRLGSCRVCEKEGVVGWLCITCARQRGECSALFGNCERTVGPATRDVTFRLWAFDPNAERNGMPRNECRIQAGAKSLPLWVEVQNEKGETPEFQTPGGGKRFDCCQTMFYLVDGPGISGAKTMFHGDVGARSRMMGPAALQKGSATEQVQLVAGELFATPGTYTVRAVAGRLVSNALTVIVEPGTDAQREAKREAEAKAQNERKQQIDRELEMKQRAMEERGQ